MVLMWGEKWFHYSHKDLKTKKQLRDWGESQTQIGLLFTCCLDIYIVKIIPTINKLWHGTFTVSTWFKQPFHLQRKSNVYPQNKTSSLSTVACYASSCQQNHASQQMGSVHYGEPILHSKISSVNTCWWTITSGPLPEMTTLKDTNIQPYSRSCCPRLQAHVDEAKKHQKETHTHMFSVFGAESEQMFPHTKSCSITVQNTRRRWQQASSEISSMWCSARSWSTAAIGSVVTMMTADLSSTEYPCTSHAHSTLKLSKATSKRRKA